MNIWAWVEKIQDELRANGRERLADLMDLVPHYMSENLHEQLDAVMPEALALAREAKNPWIEVYLRHWNLQSCVLQRYLVRDNLTEAVSLLEFANREDTKECPQSVCTTQDLASCYAQLDGPGYVEERLAVASETLARITSDWPCFTCISGEYATALIDAGRAADALAFVEKQRAELVRIGRAERRDDMCGTEVEALVLLGRLEDAMSLNDRAALSHRGASFQEFRKLDRARILARMGRFEEAKEELLPFDVVARTHSQYEPWTDAVVHLVAGGAMENDWRLGAKLARLVRAMRENGVVRRAISIARSAARLALDRRRPWIAERMAAQIAAMIPELRAPLGAPEELAALRASIAAAPPVEDDAEATGDPELALRRLERVLAERPGDEDAVEELARALLAIEDEPAALELLRGHLARDPESPSVLNVLAQRLRATGRDRELDALAAGVLERATRPETVATAHWVLALRDKERGALEPARAHLERILEVQPEAVNTRVMLAEIERDLGRLESSLAHLEALARDPEVTGAVHWDRMVVATLLERWDLVRASAAHVGIQLAEGEGEIDRDGELCMIRVPGEDGRGDAVYAIRTGPVTARIVDVAHPSMPSRYGDRVVFDPAPENDPPQPGAEDDHVWVYRAVRVVRRGHYRSFVLEGVHPGNERRIALKRALSALGGNLVDVTAPDYELAYDDGGEERTVPAFYGLLAVPGDTDLAALAALLARETAGYEHPLIWPGISEALGDEAEQARQAAIAERYHIRVG